jgi:orotidine 5'-phosphate decarboxylase subfamily 2
LTPLERIAERALRTGASLCLGLDPEPASLPPGFSRDVRGIEAFARLVLEAAEPYAVAVKPNLAFYEAFGAAGIAALERIRAAVPADLPFILDAKRGDIGTTAERQAVAILDGLGCDAVTLNPYLGPDAIEPFLARGEAFIYVLCRTSNPRAAVLQDAIVAADIEAGQPAEPFHLRVARAASAWAGPDRIGFVVGATAPTELAAVRAVVPDRAFLIPGIGAQGGDIQAAVEHGPASAGVVAGRAGGGLAVNVSRGISGAWNTQGDEVTSEPGERIRAAAAAWASRIPVLR